MKCPKCGYVIGKRSTDISTRFHGWITWIARQLAIERNRIYFEVLLKAIEIECDGGDPYPYSIIPRKIKSPITNMYTWYDLPEPWRTSNRTNKQMITACAACELYWSENGEGVLPERNII